MLLLKESFEKKNMELDVVHKFGLTIIQI